MRDKINVEMGSFMVAPSPIILESKGIGSCVAVCLYEKNDKIGGMVRIMAPKGGGKDINPIRFANRGISNLLEGMFLLGCEKRHITAKIFGGASLFPNLAEIDALGRENIKVVKKKLRVLKIRIMAEDLGGNKGKSIYFDTRDGSVMIKQIGSASRKM